MPNWKNDVHKIVHEQINSYNFSGDEKEEVYAILHKICSDPLGNHSKKLKNFQVVYSARYVRHLGYDEFEFPIIEHYRFIYKVYPKRKVVVVTKFKERETVYLDIRERLDWDSMMAKMSGMKSQSGLANH